MLTEEYKNNQRLCFMCEDVIITIEVRVVNMKILSAAFCQTCVIVEA